MSARALLVLYTATALQNAKDWHGAAYDAAPRAAAEQGLGGRRRSPSRRMPPGARLAEIPVWPLTADAARAVLGGKSRGARGAAQIERALLRTCGLITRAGRAPRKAYVDSLPWAIVEDVKLKDAWRPTIIRIADRAGRR